MEYEKDQAKTSQSEGRPLAVVTGASSGIGKALAKEFVTHGFDLLIAAEDDEIRNAAQELKADGASVESIQIDLASSDGVETLYRKVQELRRPVEAIAINAGVGVFGDFARETELEDELNLIRLNVVSSVHLAKLIVKDMVQRGNGRVLFTSSIASTMPGPMYAAYAASKAFLQSFSEAIREELKDTGVTVTALMPGATETNFFRRAGMENTKVAQAEKDDPALVARQGFEAMMEGKDSIVAGSFANKLRAASARILPEAAQAKIHARQFGEEGKRAAKKKKAG